MYSGAGPLSGANQKTFAHCEACRFWPKPDINPITVRVSERWVDHSPLMFAALMIGHHLSISLR
jgi:hypothetical protein